MGSPVPIPSVAYGAGGRLLQELDGSPRLALQPVVAAEARLVIVIVVVVVVVVYIYIYIYIYRERERVREREIIDNTTIAIL